MSTTAASEPYQLVNVRCITCSKLFELQAPPSVLDGKRAKFRFYCALCYEGKTKR